MLILTIISSQVVTTREKMIKFGVVQESEVPIILCTNGNKLKDKSYVECNNAYECEMDDFIDGLWNKSVKKTGGVLSDIDLLAVLKGVLSSNQVSEEIKNKYAMDRLIQLI